MKTNRTHVEIEGKQLVLANLDKVLYPGCGFTKAQVLDYYRRVAPALLPHLRGRPVTMKRYPEGVDGEFFYEKRCPSHRPKWVETAGIRSDSRGSPINYCTIDSLASLVWVANLASLELHVLLARYPEVDRPTFMVFDLDPGPPANIIDSCRVAQWLRDWLAEQGLESLAKTSGGKGLHVYVPLNTPVTHERTKAFAKSLAERMERDHPQEVTSRMLKKLRGGKVFIDWSQNDRHKTTVCVYSLRARERPTCSTPVSWSEVDAALRAGDGARLHFEAEDIIKRVDRKGDLFEPVLKLKQKLPD